MAKTATKPAAKSGAQPSKIPSEDLIRHYRDMLLIRRFEEKGGSRG
jgi:TPP-dependent pyruvate/acetoin dehydrogenase alpha subunit